MLVETTNNFARHVRIVEGVVENMPMLQDATRSERSESRSSCGLSSLRKRRFIAAIPMVAMEAKDWHRGKPTTHGAMPMTARTIHACLAAAAWPVVWLF